MHELSIATQLLSQALNAAAGSDAGRIDIVRVELGAMQLVVPEALQTAFHACAEGSLAENAILEIAAVETKAVCRECGHGFTPEIANYMCPSCHAANAEIIQGRDIILTSMECTINEGQDHDSGKSNP